MKITESQIEGNMHKTFNIYCDESKELEEKSNVQKMHISGSDKPVKYYNNFISDFDREIKRIAVKKDEH